jgi:hypothetical protein
MPDRPDPAAADFLMVSSSLWVGLVVVALVGYATARITAYEGLPTPAGQRLLAATEPMARRVGRTATAGVVLLVGTALVWLVCWPLGSLAHSLEDAVDWPVFRWAQAHQVRWWTSINDVLTLMGNRPETKTLCVVAGVALAVVWRHGRWWIPPSVIAAAFVVEKYTQKSLALAVHRGHPPTTLGTYPSGGCARLLSIVGTIVFLVLVTWEPPRRVRVTAWTVFAGAVLVEGYTRTYLLKHWVTDVVGGWVLGLLLLVAFCAAARVWAGDHPVSHRAATTSPTSSATRAEP